MEGIVLFILIGLGMLVLVAGLAYLGYLQEKKRQEAFEQVAARQRLAYSSERDTSIPAHFAILDNLKKGSNRYAQHVFTGNFQGYPVVVFEYHYSTHSTDSKGRRKTKHHWFSIFTLQLPKEFPELTIVKEGLFSKVYQAMGFDDIDFESAEFSRTFLVRSPDKKFAYDYCHPRTMDYLLANQDLSIEIEGSTLATIFRKRLKPETIETDLNRIVQLRELFPDYVLNES